MLTAAARIAPRGVYVAGNTTSSSGLTVTVVKDASGDFALEAGALVMGDQVRLLSDGPRSASLSVPLGASLMTSQSLPNCHNSLMTQAECPAELALHADSRPANQGCCCIDEFDKMTGGQHQALLEAMEQQTISVIAC